jgi:hypothetical protein
MPDMTDGKRHGAASYFVVAIVCIDDDIVTVEPVHCISAQAAIGCAQALVNEYGSVGALALRKSDHQSDRLYVLRPFGDVPHGEQINLANGWHVAAWDEQWGGVNVFG